MSASETTDTIFKPFLCLYQCSMIFVFEGILQILWNHIHNIYFTFDLYIYIYIYMSFSFLEVIMKYHLTPSKMNRIYHKKMLNSKHFLTCVYGSLWRQRHQVALQMQARAKYLKYHLQVQSADYCQYFVLVSFSNSKSSMCWHPLQSFLKNIHFQLLFLSFLCSWRVPLV